jgi:hypothetical protein
MDLDKLNKLTLDDIAENPEVYLGGQIDTPPVSRTL